MLQRQIEHPVPVQVTRATQVGFREILSIVIRRRWVILGVALPIILFATIGTLRSATTTVANARVMIEARQPETPSFGSGSVDYDVLMSAAAQIAASIPVAERAAVALMDSLPVFQQIDPGMAEVRTVTALRRRVLAGVDCGPVGESNILNIAFRHTNPRIALAAAGALVTAYIDYSVESQQNIKAIGYYTDQIHGVQVGIDSLMGVRARIREKAGYSYLQSDAQLGVGHIMATEESFLDARAAREGLQAKFDALLQAIADNPDYVPGMRAGEYQNLVGNKNRLDEALENLAKLRVQYQDSSEWVRRQNEIVESARADLLRQRDNYVQDIRIDLAEAMRTESTLETALAAQKAALADFPEIERQVGFIDIQIATQQDLLETLQTKRGEVRLKAGSDLRIASVVPLDEPSLATQVGGGKKILYLSLAGIFAIVIGFLTALFAENQDHRLYDTRQAEQYLEVPVLGSISQSEGVKRLP